MWHIESYVSIGFKEVNTDTIKASAQYLLCSLASHLLLIFQELYEYYTSIPYFS